MENIQYLTDEEVERFLECMDSDKDGFISYAEVEAKLDQVHDEIAPHAKEHNLHHESRDDAERHEFLRSVIGTDRDRLPRAEFARTVASWNIPSLEQEKREEQEMKDYMRSVSFNRRLRAYWSVQGPETVFIALVVSMQLAFGIWQMVKYLIEPQWRPAFGWGVIMSKTSAGALYPTLFFLVLSMSRWLSTYLRRFYRVSRFINVDLSHGFHVKISIVALVLSTTHAIGHLGGSFVFGSMPSRQDAVAALLGPDAVPRPYSAYAASLAGWTGLAAYGIFLAITLFSIPAVRRWNYEVFQLIHLLMFPMIAFLMAHGTEAILQFPMLGYWLALPTLLVTAERFARFCLGLYRIPASLEVLDSETVCITVQIPARRHWPYKAGQYILLQVPQISLFQWHPLTISTCIGNEMQVHIKTEGNWVSKLQNMEKGTSSELKYVGIDGPYGAPAQRFYDFDQTIIIGAGIGVTPFSGILTDLQTREEKKGEESPPPTSTSLKSAATTDKPLPSPTDESISTAEKPSQSQSTLDPCRRVDFHWIVRDRNSLLWFSDLLNEAQESTRRCSVQHHSCLDIRIQTHVTQRRKNISTHIFRVLLERHRTDLHPWSPLTGLLNPTHFGRPDLGRIMAEHYESMLGVGKGAGCTDSEIKRKRKVGVFFCGAPVIGYELADRCRMMTARGRAEGSLIEYHFMLEVF